ncbi:Transcription initiation factor TFIID subunit 4 [Liparis tanakae]|uniref:Transcription initiation factor TFIID subunit 4 n=1 Tax=Liparis tanakae TaxID=230148 RepID=A0A4Z2HAB8_9TELE|nr:Transcription initiation factor TFIID subunit 4 [Liparis tanakae]
MIQGQEAKRSEGGSPGLPAPLSQERLGCTALLETSTTEDECYEQSAEVRSQLRFFEQLERMEKQRKDEQEREILLKAAKAELGAVSSAASSYQLLKPPPLPEQRVIQATWSGAQGSPPVLIDTRFAS